MELIVGMKEMPELTMHSLVLLDVQHDFTAQLAHLVTALQNTADGYCYLCFSRDFLKSVGSVRRSAG